MRTTLFAVLLAGILLSGCLEENPRSHQVSIYVGSMLEADSTPPPAFDAEMTVRMRHEGRSKNLSFTSDLDLHGVLYHERLVVPGEIVLPSRYRAGELELEIVTRELPDSPYQGHWTWPIDIFANGTIRFSSVLFLVEPRENGLAVTFYDSWNDTAGGSSGPTGPKFQERYDKLGHPPGPIVT